MLSTGDSLKAKDTNKWKLKGCRKIHHENSNQKRAGVTILVPEKIDFNTKLFQEKKKDIL